jgi:hypothetical protein
MMHDAYDPWNETKKKHRKKSNIWFFLWVVTWRLKRVLHRWDPCIEVTSNSRGCLEINSQSLNILSLPKHLIDLALKPSRISGYKRRMWQGVDDPNF